MSKTLSWLSVILLSLVFAPLTVRADPLVITNGFLSITGISGGQQYFLASGNEFAILGAGAKGASSPQACSPCASGSTISVNGFFTGDSLGFGSAAFNGMVFPNVGFAGSFTFVGPALVVPFSLTDVTLTSPFTFSGHNVSACLVDCVSSFNPLFTVDLVGSGVATIDLRFSGMGAGGQPIFSFRNVTYDFQTPEPVSILLLGTALVALGAKLRRNRPS